MVEDLKNKLDKLPKQPGVYFFKDDKGKIIYIGKASILKNRVKSYFQTSKNHDFKTKLLIKEISDLSWLTVESEIDALFLESAMIKRYKPQFNIDLKDDKNFLYIKIPVHERFPVVQFVRRPLDDKARYFGPYTSSFAVRKAMRFLRRVFPYYTSSLQLKETSLDHHLGLCPPLEPTKQNSLYYKRGLTCLTQYLKGEGKQVIRKLEKEMKQAAIGQNFEQAAKLRDKVFNLKALSKQHLFGDKELFDLSRDQALVELKQMLRLNKLPRRIEAYDISHIQGSSNTASLVVFSDGVPNRGEYRKFKMRLEGNDDCAHINEVIKRRLSHTEWEKPDLIVIDGGKGQVKAAIYALKEAKVCIPLLGLAKRFEQIILPVSWLKTITNNKKNVEQIKPLFYKTIQLPKTSHMLKLLQHIRDEAHRFAISYHTSLRSKQQTLSVLDAIPGIGTATRKKIMNQFSNLSQLKKTPVDVLAKSIGSAKAQRIKEYL